MLTRTALILGLMLASLSVHAQVTYEYTGAPVSGIVTSCSLACTTSMPVITYTPLSATISGLMQLNAPLAPNLTDVSIAPPSLLFSSAGSPGIVGTGAYMFCCSGWVVQSDSFTFSTNAEGDISGWDVKLSAYQPGTNTPAPWTITMSSTTGDTSYFDDISTSGAGRTGTLSNDVSGTWTRVPEINGAGTSSALTVLAGLLLILSERRRQRAARVNKSPCVDAACRYESVGVLVAGLLSNDVKRVLRCSRAAAGTNSEHPHSFQESAAVGWPSGIDDRRDLAQVLRSNVRRIHDKRPHSGRMGVTEAMNHSTRRGHGIPRPQVARLAAHGVAQNALQHVHQFFIICVAVRRGHFRARRHSHFEAPHLTAVPGLLYVPDLYLPNLDGLRT